MPQGPCTCCTLLLVHFSLRSSHAGVLFSTQLKSHLSLRKAVCVKQHSRNNFTSWDTQMMPSAWRDTGSASPPAWGLRSQYLHSPDTHSWCHRTPTSMLCPLPSTTYTQIYYWTWWNRTSFKVYRSGSFDRVFQTCPFCLPFPILKAEWKWLLPNFLACSEKERSG